VLRNRAPGYANENTRFTSEGERLAIAHIAQREIWLYHYLATLSNEVEEFNLYEGSFNDAEHVDEVYFATGRLFSKIQCKIREDELNMKISRCSPERICLNRQLCSETVLKKSTVSEWGHDMCFVTVTECISLLCYMSLFLSS
jgi:hypothetical protein